MKTKTYLNGSGSTVEQGIARIEQRLNRLREDLKDLHQRKPENGFKKFTQNIFDRRQN